MRTVAAEVPIAVVGWDGIEPPVLYVHATGFHKWVWHKTARLVGRTAVAMDTRGHGDSGKPPDGYHWDRFAEDVLAVVDQLDLPHTVDAVGHSSGGAALLLAEVARPGTFRRLALCEPIVFPPIPPEPPTMAEGARRRRMVFSSPDEAAANYLSKPPLNNWDPEVMDDYVRHGMDRLADGTWQLKCSGEVEAQVYENSSTHAAWDHLPEVACPTLIVRGALDLGPSLLAEQQAARLPRGEVVVMEGTGHFAPMEQPKEFAAIVRAWVNRDLPAG